MNLADETQKDIGVLCPETMSYYKQVAVVGSRFVSIYDGKTEVRCYWTGCVQSWAYLSQYKLGVSMEQNVLVTQKSGECFTAAVPLLSVDL